jgi:hypothetical protein
MSKHRYISIVFLFNQTSGFSLFNSTSLGQKRFVPTAKTGLCWRA